MKKFWEAIIVLALLIGGYLLFFGTRHVSIPISPAQNGSKSGIVSNTPATSSDVGSNPQVASTAPSNAVEPDQLASRAASPNSATATGSETNVLPILPPA